jgi:hypothetical protein
MSGPGVEGVGTWVNVYVPDGTPVRNAKDTMLIEASDERPVRLVIGEGDELVIDMSEETARLIADALNTTTDAHAGVRREVDGAVP